MEQIQIICVDDQRDVLAALLKDLDVFEAVFPVSDCESAQEARELLEEFDEKGMPAGLIICDHIMPEQNGIDFLAEIAEDTRFAKIKKLLLTGLATHADTIRAINNAHIDHYIEKPWQSDELADIIKKLLTAFVVENGYDYTRYGDLMDRDILLRDSRNRLF